MQELRQSLLLQELLGEVLEVALRERNSSSHSDLLVSYNPHPNQRSRFKYIQYQYVLRTLTVNLDLVTKLAGLAINLDTVVEVLLKRGAVEKTVACGAGKVDDMFRLDGGLRGGLWGLNEGQTG